MRKLLCITISVIIICLTAVPCFGASPALSVSADKTCANAGDTVTVSVNLSANSGLCGVKFKIKYDTSYFSYVSGSLSDGGIFMGAPKDNTDGNIEYAGVSVNPVTSGGKIVSIKLKVKKPDGTISVVVTDAIDSANAKVSVSANGLKITCAHGNANWVVTKKPSCTLKGVETRTCSCGNVSNRDIAATGHKFGEWKIVKYATETQKGTKERQCSLCGAKEISEIPVLNVSKPETTSQVINTTGAAVTTNDAVTVTGNSAEVTNIEFSEYPSANGEVQSENATVDQNETATVENNGDTVRKPKKSMIKSIVTNVFMFVLGSGLTAVAFILYIKRKQKEEK